MTQCREVVMFIKTKNLAGVMSTLVYRLNYYIMGLKKQGVILERKINARLRLQMQYRNSGEVH